MVSVTFKSLDGKQGVAQYSSEEIRDSKSGPYLRKSVLYLIARRISPMGDAGRLELLVLHQLNT
jgi:hypothetical protein